MSSPEQIQDLGRRSLRIMARLSPALAPPARSQVSRFVANLIASLELLEQLKREEGVVEGRRKEDEEQRQHTKQEIEQMIKSLDKHARDLLTKARQQRGRFENVRTEEFISSKDTKDIEAKIVQVERLIAEIHTLQQQLKIEGEKVYEKHKVAGSQSIAEGTSKEVQILKQKIATAVANIKKLLDDIKSDINLEKRLGRREIRLLNLFIQSHREVIASAQQFKTEIEGVVQAVSNKREAAEFMEKLTTAQRAVEEFIESESKEGAAVERIGEFMKQRNTVEQNIIQYLEQLKSELQPNKEIHSELDALASRLRECKESLVYSEEAIVNFFQSETDNMNKSLAILQKLENAVNDIFKALVPSAINRTINRLFGSAGESLLHRTGNTNP